VRLRKFRCPYQLVLDGEVPTASWEIGSGGVTSIQALGGGVVIIAVEGRDSIMISPSGYGMVAVEQVVKGKQK